MKKIITICLCIYAVTMFSQQSDFWNNVQFGGGIGASFGSNITTVAISPTLVYNFNDSFSLGASIGYQYSKRNSYKSNVFSPGIVSLYNPSENIQLSAEFEQLYVNQSFSGNKSNYQYPALHLGGAYNLNQNIALGFRYDILHDKVKSIYASAFSPIVRIFF
mgnify:FL=1